MLNYKLARSEFQPLGISSRSLNALVARNICSRIDLARFTEDEIARIPGIGAASLAKLKPYLRKELLPEAGPSEVPRGVTVQFQPASINAIESWAKDQEGITSRAEAVRRLVELGLRSESKKPGPRE
jgi:hypothetical protein